MFVLWLFIALFCFAVNLKILGEDSKHEDLMHEGFSMGEWAILLIASVVFPVSFVCWTIRLFLKGKS